MNTKILGQFAAVLSASALLISLATPTLAMSTKDGQGGGLVEIDGHVYGEGGINTDAISVGTDASASVDEEATSTSNSEGANEDGALLVTRADVETGAREAADIDPENVHSINELSGFIAGELSADAHVKQVETSHDAVRVVYAQKAKLFGLIPLTIDVDAIVNADGSTNLSYPWYSFLLVKDDGDLAAKVQGTAAADIGTTAGGALDEQQQARLVADIKAVMKAQFDASALASASAK